MSDLRRYVRKSGTRVTAVQIRLETPGLEYQKWGGTQRARAGDWLVENRGDVYTVSDDTFRRTYRPVSPGLFEKVTDVWARVAEEPGRIDTKEGSTEYDRGDMIVFNDPDGEDGYAISAPKFEEMYDLAE